MEQEQELLDCIEAKCATILQSYVPELHRKFAEALAGIVIYETIMTHHEFVTEKRKNNPPCKIVNLTNGE